METAKVNILLDKRNVKSNGKFPVKLIVYHNHKNKRYSLDRKIDLTEVEWDKINSPRLKQQELVPIKEHLEKEKGRALKIVKQLNEEFAYDIFESLFFGKRQLKSFDKHKISTIFEEHINALRERGSIGTANSYITALKSILSFSPNLSRINITPEFLMKYEQWMIKGGKSVTTVGIYLRSLRTILNIAKDRGLVSYASYPFGQKSKKKYEIPIGRNIKKALSIEDIRKIRDAIDLTKDAEFARDIWMFSFYCNGMNIMDICRLKYVNMSDGFIHFLRSKTIRTQRDKTPVEVFLNDSAKAIIEKWGQKDKECYVFDIISEDMMPEVEYNTIKNFTRSINHYMKVIAKNEGIECNLTTYVARHSYATILKNMNTSIEEISESLGHSNITTTKNYLASFPQERKKETAQKIAKLI